MTKRSLHRFGKTWPLALIVTGVVLLVWALFGPRIPANNPDPNHTHADFAVWVGGVQLDFSDARYMSGSSEDVTHEGALHKYFHLHDGNGNVVHRHKPGLGLDEFFTSLGMTVSGSCLTLDDAQYARLDPGWKSDFAVEPQLCDTGKFRWRMLVNGVEQPVDFGYVFADVDSILYIYSAGDTSLEELRLMTDDACRYSQTCPERGKPPAENCISDPAVPCME